MTTRVHVESLARKGYIRYPRTLLDFIIPGLCENHEGEIELGIMAYLYSKVAYSAYVHKELGLEIGVGECYIRLNQMAQVLGCSLYKARQGMDKLEKENIVQKRRICHGIAVQVIGYERLIVGNKKQVSK